jgi:hypothetical protein
VFVEPGDFNDEFAARPFEDGDAVGMVRLRKPERRCNLTPRGAPDQAGDLGVTVEGGEGGAGQGVEEMDASVVGAAADGEETALPGAESDGFDGGGESESVAGEKCGYAER